MTNEASVEKIVEMMEKLEIFQGLSRNRLTDLISVGELSDCPPDVVLFKQGDVGDQMYVVIEGSLEVTSEGRRELFLLGAGEVLGEIGLLDGLPRTATVTSAEQCLLFGMNRDKFETMLKLAPRFALNVMTVTNHKIRNALGREEALNATLKEANTELERLNDSLEGMVDLKTQQFERASQSLGGMLETDALTGAYTRQKFEEMLNTLVRQEKEFSLVLFGLDHFEAIRDTHGEQTAQRVLIKLSELASARLTGNQHLARFRDDKFGILLEDCDMESAMSIAESIRHTIEFHHFPIRGCAPGYVTASMGVSHYPTHGNGSAPVLEGAKAALAQARDGRNLVAGCQSKKEAL